MLLFGVGRKSYQESINDVLKGKYGDEWEASAKDEEHYEIDARKCLYWCPKCHCFENQQDLTVYEIDKSSSEKKLYKKFTKNCPKCNTKMKIIHLDDLEGLKLVCSYCGGELERFDNMISLFWD